METGPTREAIDGEWIEVLRGRRPPVNKNSEKAAPIWKNCYSFFVANLPEACSTELLRKAYGGCGVMIDAFVSRNKDRRGGTFGFIRFRKQSDLPNLLSDLNKVVFENRKPSVSLPRFDRDGKEIIYRSEVMQHFVQKNKEPIEKVNRDVSNGVSYREVVAPRIPPNPVVNVIEDDISNDSSYEFLEKKSLYGYMKDLDQLNKVKANLLSLGKEAMSLRYLGGLRVLISFKNTDDANSFLSNKSIWKNWFFSLCWWKNQKLDFERVAWIKVSGIPPALWKASLCDAVAARYGEVIHGSTARAEDGNFAFDLIGLLVKSGLYVSGRCSITQKDNTYDVWVQEVLPVWLPDNFYVKKNPGIPVSEFRKDSDDESGESEEVEKDGSPVQERVSEKSRPSEEVQEKVCEMLHGEVISGADMLNEADLCAEVQNVVEINSQNLNNGDSNSRIHEEVQKELGILPPAGEGISQPAPTLMEERVLQGVNGDPFDIDRFINHDLENEAQHVSHGSGKSIADDVTDEGLTLPRMDLENGAPVPDLNHSYHSALSGHSDQSVHSDESIAKEDNAEIEIESLISPMPKQPDKTQENKKGQKKGGKKATKRKNDINWRSFIGGIASPDEHVQEPGSKDSIQAAIDLETQETMRVGKLIGCDLTGFEDKIEASIREEGVNTLLV